MLILMMFDMTGSFQEAFDNHARTYGRSVVQAWRDALTEIGKLKGWVLSEVENGDECCNVSTHNLHFLNNCKNESKLVELVVERALSEKTSIPFIDTQYRIGLGSRVNDLLSLLNARNKDVQYIGIGGIGGIGKTTIAKAFYNCISKNFHQSIFLANVREEASSVCGLVSLQKKLIRRFSKKVNDDISSVDHGKQIIERRLNGENVLLILDDVDHDSQLNAFALDLNWLGQGSTVIITTRDEKILNVAKIDKDNIYWPMELDDGQSLQLFSLHAFQHNKPLEEYIEFSHIVARYLGGLPLTLEVLGSCLSNVRDKKDWECTIKQLRECALKEIHEKLRISYDNLENECQKTIFLDSACFFVGWEKEIVTSIWEACGFHHKSALARLIQRSLLRFEYDESGKCCLRMHDQVQCMGKEIVSKEYLREPSKRSRLWSHDEILEVLEEKKKTDEIEGIVLPSGLPITLTSEHFEMMHKLRLLNVNGLPETRKRADQESSFADFWRLPNALRWFKWTKCSWDFLPTNFFHKRLIHLDLSFSMIKQTWITSPRGEGNKFHNLRVLNLSNCEDLSHFPSFQWFPCLEKLDLGYCWKLCRLDESIGELSRLKSLNLEYCDSLEELPITIGNLKALVKLKLRDVTKIEELPSGLGLLGILEELDASNCYSLVSLPDLSEMKILRRLNLSHCFELGPIQGIEGSKSFEILDATSCNRLTHPSWRVFGQGSLIVERTEEFSYSLTADGGRCYNGLVLCIVFEGLQPNYYYSLNTRCEISVSIKQNDKIARFHHSLLICDCFESPKKGEVIYLHYFEGFDWFGFSLKGKDAIENLVIRQTDFYSHRWRLKFWKLLFRKPGQPKPNVADFFSWSDGEPDGLNWPKLERHGHGWRNMLGPWPLCCEVDVKSQNSKEENTK